MGLFDKIKDNAKTISMRAIEATREYDEDYVETQRTSAAAQPTDDALALEAPSSVVEPTTPIEEAVEQPVEPETEQEVKLVEEDQKPEPEANKDSEEKAEDTKPARKSKITEVPKEEVKQKDEKSKTTYRPFYKSSLPDDKDKADDKKIEVKKSLTTRSSSGIIDVTPHKQQDPVKQAIFARERAAMAALASQRRLNGTVPLYVASHMNFKTRVFINRIEYSGSFGKNTLPIEQVAWVKVRNGGTGVILETTEGKRVVMVVKQTDRLAFVDAIMKVQAMQPKRGKLKDNQTVRIDKLEQFGEGIDEIEKLAKLYDKGILSQEEFETKKKQILGI